MTQFDVAKPYVDQFEEHQVGGAIHRELWVPAEELDEFNQHIVERIQVIGAFYGEWYQATLSANDLPDSLTNWVKENKVAVQINFAYWKKQNLRYDIIQIAEAWRGLFPDIRLFGS